MTNPITPHAHSPRSNSVPTALFTNLTRSMMASDPGLQNIEAQLNRGGARLSNIGRLAQALDQFQAGVSKPAGGEPGNAKDFVDAVGTLATSLRDLKTSDSADVPMIARIQEQMDGILGAAGASAADPDSLARAFGAAGSGLSHQLASLVTQHMAEGGMLASQAAKVRGDVDKLTAEKTGMTDAISRQAQTLVRQYSQTMAGGSVMFGTSGDARPVSLFDMLA